MSSPQAPLPCLPSTSDTGQYMGQYHVREVQEGTLVYWKKAVFESRALGSSLNSDTNLPYTFGQAI